MATKIVRSKPDDAANHRPEHSVSLQACPLVRSYLDFKAHMHNGRSWPDLTGYTDWDDLPAVDPTWPEPRSTL
jgi:hypothetical protein